KSSVMRLAYSAEISSCLKDGISPVFDMETVGKASSSVTPGSSMASVAGKKRLPTISCARAVDAASVTANMTKGHEFLNMGNPSIAMTEKQAALNAATTSGNTGGTSRKTGLADNCIVPGTIDGWRN